MFFNSLAFAVFLPTVVLLYWVLPAKYRTGLLLVASYVFYGWWDVRFLSLIFVSTVVDYFTAIRMDSEQRSHVRKRWLWVSIAVNLGLLGFFKYWGFFVESAATALTSLGLEPNLPTLQILLPAGISFYSFQTLSYAIDVFRREMKPERSLPQFALFVAFFPQLVAGPIERARNLLPQLRNLPTNPSTIDWSGSATLIVRGLFRKVVIADGLAPIVNQVFGAPGRFGSLTVAMGVIAFSLQIYGDFAGYTDIARGTARLFGVDLMENFRAPYFATGFADFWRRWHISLSTWLRDYLYIPLGGSHGGRWQTYRNLMITMLLGGLWHGAGWGFIIWGGLHGAYLVLERIARDRSTSDVKRAGLPALFVFVVVTLTWIPFRAPTLASAWNVVTALFGPLSGEQLTAAPIVLAVLGLASVALDRAGLNGRVNPIAGAPAITRGLVYGFGIVAALLLASPVAVPFIYFQF